MHFDAVLSIKLQKRKLSDMLGPKWSDEDLTHFYQAYRKYGKDWKKVCPNSMCNPLIEVYCISPVACIYLLLIDL